jgi:putative redox protein
MSLRVSAHSVPGTLRTDLLVDGRFQLETDEPVSVGGTGRSPSPHELLPAALAACASTTLQMYARTKGWELGQIVVDVSYDHRVSPPRCDVTIEVGGPVSPAQLARLEKVASSCPVQRAIEGGIVIDEHIGLAQAPLAESA